jgi:hypothetical protein
MVVRAPVVRFVVEAEEAEYVESGRVGKEEENVDVDVGGGEEGVGERST